MGLKLSCLLIILSLYAGAQEWIFDRKHDLRQKVTAADLGSLGKVYLGTERGNVYSFQADGTPDSDYSSSIFEPITSLDASNSLKVFVFYSTTAQFEFLERFTAQSRTYELRDFQIASAELACVGTNQTIWLVDQSNLIQLNPLNNSILQKQKLPEELWNERKTMLKSKRNDLIISTESDGVYYLTSDMNALSSMDKNEVRAFTLEEERVVYQSGDSLLLWNPTTGRKQSIELPQSAFDLVIKSGDNYHFVIDEMVLVYHLN